MQKIQKHFSIGLVTIVIMVFVFGPIGNFNNARAATPSAYSADACLPINMPSADTLFASNKKVFAHFFNRFPLSIDNVAAANDYYATQYLTPSGENNKWLAEGGFLRSRPIYVTAPASNYQIENLKYEVRLAIARGITGFTFDILSLSDLDAGSYLPNMIAAAQSVDSRFQIVLMPDMAAMGPDTNNVIQIVRAMYNQPSLYRLNGKPVIAPFLSESVTPSAWAAMKTQLVSESLPIVFMPTFLSLPPQYVSDYQAVSDGGFGTFGTALPAQLQNTAAEITAAHNAGKPYMAGIGSQSYRPKDYIYWEANNSLAYRNGWTAAINGGTESVQLTTWNDLSESSSVSPYTDQYGSAGTGFFNLTGYYASWFLTGIQPTIIRDVLYYFYRKEPVGAAAPNAGQVTTKVDSPNASADEIELLGFLTAPGTLKIVIGGQTYTSSVGAGMQSFKVPLGVGTPNFSLIRSSAAVIDFNGTTPIVGLGGLSSGYADLTYWSGSASANGTCFSDAFAYGNLGAVPVQAPYNGTPFAVPGTIQAEDFDNGGEGLAYHDSDTVNDPAQYRSTGVDIKPSSDTGGGYAVGYMVNGEWLEYTINVAATGNYDINTRVAAISAGKSFRIEFDGVDKTGPLTVPITGSAWDTTWATVTKTNVNLTAGQHVMRFYANNDAFDINYFTISNATALVGDLNIDHIVNSVDWSIMNGKWFTSDVNADLNHDGIVNAIDYSVLNGNWFKTW